VALQQVEAAGVTALHLAAWAGWEEGMLLLLRLGAPSAWRHVSLGT
jgi:hypothetical protein